MLLTLIPSYQWTFKIVPSTTQEFILTALKEANLRVDGRSATDSRPVSEKQWLGGTFS